MLFSSPSRKYNEVVLIREEIGKSITKPINKCHNTCRWNLRREVHELKVSSCDTVRPHLKQVNKHETMPIVKMCPDQYKCWGGSNSIILVVLLAFWIYKPYRVNALLHTCFPPCNSVSAFLNKALHLIHNSGSKLLFHFCFFFIKIPTALV